MSQKFSIAPRRWYGLLEVPCTQPGLAASPVFVTSVEPLKTGAGLLRLQYLHPLKPYMAEASTVTMRVRQHTPDYLVGSIEDAAGQDTVILSEVTFEWLAVYCPELQKRRPVVGCTLTVDGAPLYETTVVDHLTSVFGATEREILLGAAPDSFECVPHALPALRAYLSLGRPYSAFDSALIGRGVVPQAMEDKWFVFWKDGYLVFKRSWTGFVVYEVEAAWRGNELYLGQVRVNRDAEQYGETDDNYDKALLLYLIDVVLRGVSASFPMKEEADANPLAAWAIAGKASTI